MKRLTLFSFVAVAVLAAGCAVQSDDGSSADDEALTKDPLAMPAPILDFLKTNAWGTHHLEWHTVRQWDLLAASDQAYAKKQGWARADVQEGAKSNGLEFLAMHHVMIQILTTKYPSDAKYFVGWTEPPTDPKDANDPLPNGQTTPCSPSMVDAIDKIQNHLADFKSDDDFGLYVETTLRPTQADPNARATDATVGLHNYIHNRFMDEKSKIDIGDPSVNLQNKRFWRLHGWIESRWTAFRALKKLSANDPAYLAAIKKGEDMLAPIAKGLPGGTYGVEEPPPASLTKFFEKNP